jgi:starch synthase (maltosyl-transferring)
VTGRIVIDDIRPRTREAGYPAKAVVGEAVAVRAVIFKDGHDILAARALLYPEGSASPERVGELVPGVDDEWTGILRPARLGRHQIVVQAWTDRHATWAARVAARLEAGQDPAVELAEGLELLRPARAEPAVAYALGRLADETLSAEARLEPALRPEVAAALAGPEGSPDLTVAAPKPLWVDRERALVGAWYELFPRSVGGLKGTAERVPELAALGFDVLYLPPIHPIGTSHRKGRNNSLVAGPDDPGSPWAIGSSEGGHTAIHPELGTPEDFRHLVEVAAAHGMEIALDYALQCSPDHPWVTDHPEWFHHRPDGSIAYAENPPKKYQDIYPLNFWPARDEARVALWQACRGILEHWIGEGVCIFRVDNPHTKPVAFWEWLIPTVQSEHPEVIFLAEAFTRPRVMEKLAEVGFSQSYTYFTWRTERDGPEGLWAYMDQLTSGPAADFLRPNFWPNTPDILSGPLRNGPPAAFALRLVLAATLGPSYGIYSGYELYENEPASETNEEYLHSEKYEIKHRDFDRPGTLSPLIASLNAVRRRHPALQRLRNLTLLATDNPAIFAYAKLSEDRTDALVVAVTLDPVRAQETILHLPLATLGLPADRPYVVADELSGERYVWNGPSAFVRFEPWSRVAHVLDLRAGSAEVAP